jgi:hypothetical protein
MAPSPYIDAAEVARFGLDAAAEAQIQAASDIINAHLKRPEGLVWLPDFMGQPCFMAGLDPIGSFTAQAAITPGFNVVVAVGSGVRASLLGEALVLDRHADDQVEVCAISAFDVASQTITLTRCLKPHALGTQMEMGLLLSEDRPLSSRRPVAQVSRAPIARLVSGIGRYAAARGSTSGFTDQTYGLLETVSRFGTGPIWSGFDVDSADRVDSTGEIWIPSGPLLANFSDVRLRYVAGYRFNALPEGIKRATAKIASGLAESPSSAAISSYGFADIRMTRFSDSVLDGECRALLAPYVARAFA